jgi:hypothetical protein
MLGLLLVLLCFEIGNIDVLGATMCKLFDLAGWEGGLNAYDVYVMI